MRKIATMLAACCLFMGGVSSQADATLLKIGSNDLFFNNFENLFDSRGNWVDSVNNASRGVQIGDVFMGIINVQNIDQAGTTHFYSSATDQLTGIFAQKVVGITPETINIGTGTIEGVHLDFAPTSITTFQKNNETINIGNLLAAGEMLALYSQSGSGTTPFESNGSMSDDISKATDGTKWATFGLTPTGNMGTGYFYSHITAQQTPISNFAGEAFAALNLLYNNTGFSAFGGVNDPNENEKGGTSLLTQLYMTSELEWNPDNQKITNPSPWIFRSNDPANIQPVPEPSTILLLGAGLVGVAAFGRKRMNK